MKIPTFKKKLPYSRTCTGFGKINSCFMFTFSQYIKKSILVGKNDTANNENNAH